MSNSLNYPTRSWLFTPATRPERFAKASESGTDVSIIDLEDSVTLNDKADARQNAMNLLSSRPSTSLKLALRINGLDTHAGIEDLYTLLECNVFPDYIILPKTESAAHLQILDHLLTMTGSDTRLIGIIESVTALNAVESIVSATPRLSGLMFGAADMAADLGAALAWEPLVQVRARIVAACAMKSILAIDAPFFGIHDFSGLQDETLRASNFGFSAKSAIHPTQISLINTTFTPTTAEINRARSVVAENVKGVGTVNGVMIDEAVARQARRLLARAGIVD
ncbi:TPA: itaconate degradation C-C-lyase RipC [Citrobacter braakii]|uniref:itaconate degradation C-C-lyase RipC n=1 Tax=Citrobacter sp. Cb031 TaxID=2985025 RepID=UPI00258108AC|nr:itaconate degradation C-C-lyase RipC [Citrobacter sp. Cb031]MDM3464673.1 itaconate degradation C-C-lyase RipC [Citrobacter sp. Cb031]